MNYEVARSKQFSNTTFSEILDNGFPGEVHYRKVGSFDDDEALGFTTFPESRSSPKCIVLGERHLS
jgi:hypothetical protein